MTDGQGEDVESPERPKALKKRRVRHFGRLKALHQRITRGGTEVLVDFRPTCTFCERKATLGALTIFGQWCWLCEKCKLTYWTGRLGLGDGQEVVVRLTAKERHDLAKGGKGGKSRGRCPTMAESIETIRKMFETGG